MISIGEMNYGTMYNAHVSFGHWPGRLSAESPSRFSTYNKIYCIRTIQNTERNPVNIYLYKCFYTTEITYVS